MAKGIFRIITKLIPGIPKPPAPKKEKFHEQEYSPGKGTQGSKPVPPPYTPHPGPSGMKPENTRDTGPTPPIHQQQVNPAAPNVENPTSPPTVKEKPASTDVPLKGEVVDAPRSSRQSQTAEIAATPQSREKEAAAAKARHDAYLSGVRQLMSMRLDPDIFTDAMEELRDKYYGPYSPPPEVKLLADRIIEGRKN